MNIYNRFYDRLKDYPYDEEPIFGDVYLSPRRMRSLCLTAIWVST